MYIEQNTFQTIWGKNSASVSVKPAAILNCCFLKKSSEYPEAISFDLLGNHNLLT